MKQFVILSVLCNFFFLTLAQKPSIDTSILGKWPSIGRTGISNNGKFYYFMLNEISPPVSTLIFQSDVPGWKIKISNVSQNFVDFSTNSKLALYIKSTDSLEILSLGDSSIEYIPNVSSFKLSGKITNEWLAYLKNTPEKNLILYNLSSKKRLAITSVCDYLFSKDGKTVLFQRESQKEKQPLKKLEWLSLATGKTVHIWEGIQASNYAFDAESKQLAFIAKNSSGGYTIYYYKQGMDSARVWVNNHQLQAEQQLVVSDNSLIFSTNGDKLKFFVEKNAADSFAATSWLSNVNVWNYKDRYLQSEQLSKNLPYELLKRKVLPAIIKTNSQKPLILVRAGEFLFDDWNQFQTNFLVIHRGLPRDTINKEYNYLYLISTDDGKRERITDRSDIALPNISPNGHFVIWYDMDSQTYWSYNVLSHLKSNISKDIPYALYDEDALRIGRKNPLFGIAGWGKSDNVIYLYDQYDIWQIDLTAIKAPINITNRYGRRAKIVYGFIDINSNNEAHVQVIDNAKGIFLSGYDRETKKNGFWKINTRLDSDPIELSTGPYCYYVPRIGVIDNIDFPRGNQPIKAKGKNKYLVRRMTAEDFSNLYLTRDFKTFKEVSNVHPESKYNWLTAELLHWEMSDGKVSQGILYKPENFDSTKKYPLIFDYYAKRSDEFHLYRAPRFSEARIDIPFYVSNGYLVFVPDIYYKPGHNGQGVLNAIVSAARYLTKFTWVDSTKLGIQGHSFGGWETNFLVTHTTLFAAACEASGVSDQVSGYGQLSSAFGDDRQTFYEQFSQGAPYGVGVTPWTRPELYIENSPIFYVNMTTTPLLMMHGDADPSVPYEQAIEMFLGLKRAGKKVWLLQYENAGHTLHGIDAKDFTIRMRQFFDYYLKNALPPLWMTEGVPASKKGTESGMELDKSGKRP